MNFSLLHRWAPPVQNAWQESFASRAQVIFIALLISIALAGSFSGVMLVNMGSNYVLSVQQGFIAAFVLFGWQPRQAFSLIKQSWQSWLLIFTLMAVLLFSSSFVFASALSPLDGSDNMRLRRFTELSAHIAFAICTYLCLKNQADTKQALHYCAALLIIIGIGIAAYLVYAWFSQGCHQLDCSHWAGHPPLFQNIRHIGEALVPVTISATFLVFTPRRPSNTCRQLATGLSAISFGVLAWLGGRGSFIAALAPIILLLFVLAKQQRLNYRQLAYWSLACLTAILIMEPFANQPFLGISSWFATPDTGTDFSSGRLLIWSTSIDIIKTSPWFGYGGDAFDLHPHFETVFNPLLRHPHNFIIQTGLETGLLGVVLITMLAVVSCKQFWRRRHKKSSFEFGAMLVFSGLFINSLTGATFFGGITQFYAMICIAIFSLELNKNANRPVINE